MKNVKLVMVALFVLSLGACKDDDEAVVDLQDPEIEISGISEGTVVWNDVPLKFEANSEVEKVEVYINGELEKTFEEAPFEHIWNASSLEDGEYTIKAIAFGKDGSKKEFLVKVKLKNTLLKLKVGEGYLTETDYSKERGFVIITDADGSTKVSKEFSNGNEIVIKRPAGFSSYEYTLTTVKGRTYESAEKPRLFLETYFVSDIDEWLLTPELEGGYYVGAVDLNFTNIPDFDYIEISDYYSKQQYYEISGISFPVTQDNSDALVTIHHGEKRRYKLVKNLITDEFREISLASMGNGVTKTLTNPFKDAIHNSLSCELKGYVTEDYANSIYITSPYSPGDDIELPYPTGIFENFRTDFDYSTDHEYYYSVINGQIPDAVMLLDVDYNLQSSDFNDYKISIDGEYDVFAAMWDNRGNESATVMVDWTIVSGKERLGFSGPAIESELKSIYPDIDLSTLEFDETGIIEASGFNGYNDYLEAASRSELGINDQSMLQAWFAPKTNGDEAGRKKNAERKVAPSLRMGRR